MRAVLTLKSDIHCGGGSMNRSNFQPVACLLLFCLLILSMAALASGAGPSQTIKAAESHADRVTGASGQAQGIAPNTSSGTAMMNLADQASERNRRACVEWCEANPECAMCRVSGLCGDGYKVMRTWEGPGSDWDACKFVSRAPRVHPRPPEGPMEIPGQLKAPVPPLPQ